MPCMETILRPVRAVTPLFAVWALSACSTLGPGADPPMVTIASFTPVSEDGMAPSFDIGLRILNPNAEALELEGIAYTVSIEGHALIQGVGNDIPVIEGYSEEVVNLTGAASFLSGLRLFADLAGAGDIDGGLAYELEAKLDPVGIGPALRIRESGRIGAERDRE